MGGMEFEFTTMEATEQKMGMSLEDIIKVKQKDAKVRRSTRKKAPKEDAGKKAPKAKVRGARPPARTGAGGRDATRSTPGRPAG